MGTRRSWDPLRGDLASEAILVGLQTIPGALDPVSHTRREGRAEGPGVPRIGPRPTSLPSRCPARRPWRVRAAHAERFTGDCTRDPERRKAPDPTFRSSPGPLLRTITLEESGW